MTRWTPRDTVRWCLSLAALATFFLPAVSLTAPPENQRLTWTAATLARNSGTQLFAPLAARLTFVQEIFHSSHPPAVLQVSGVFHIAPYIRYELLVAAACALVALALLSLRISEWAVAMASVGAICGVFTVGLLWWLASAAAQQAALAGEPPEARVRVLSGLYLLVATLGAVALLPRREAID